MDLIVTIVRHGNTFEAGEAPHRIGARTDIPLVASGREQARMLGAAFAEQRVAFDRALAAPLLRTRETIERILVGQQAPPIETAGWLTEIDHGPDEGRLESEIVARIGHQALADWDSEAQVPDGWIVNEPVRTRGWRTLWDHGEGHVLIVTSNGAARFALLSDDGLRPQVARLPALKLRTGAYGRIAREQGRLHLIDWDIRP